MHENRFVPRALLVALLAFILAACSSTSAPVGTITGIDVNVSDTLMLTPGDQVPLELSYAGTGAIPSDVTITSSNPDVVTIHENGILMALTPGEATITIASTSNPDVTLTLLTFVTDPLPSDEGYGMTGEPGEVGAIVNGEIAPATSSFQGPTLTLDAGAFTTSLTAYTPDGDAIPILTSDGLVKPTTGGTMVLTGAGFEANTPIGVYLGENTLLGSALTTSEGTYRLTVTIPADTTEGDQALTIVGQTLDASGAETALRGRSRSSGRVTTRVVNWLFPRITGMELTPATLDMNIGDQRRLSLALQSAGDIDTSVTWTTSNAAVASVSSNGTVEAISAGTATITARANADASQTASTTINVRLAPPSPSLSTFTPESTELEPGASISLTIQLIQPDGNERPVSAGPLTFADTALGTFSNIQDNEDGTYAATFTAGSESGTVTILAMIDDIPLANPVTINIEPVFFLADNGVTVICPDAKVGQTGAINGVTYTKRAREDVNGTAGIDTLISNGSGATGWDLLPSTCTSGVTDMAQLFMSQTDFNEDIASWDTSNVTTMASMFQASTDEDYEDGSLFNQAIGAWDTSNVTTMANMFLGATTFNQDLNDWDTSNVTDMSGMFQASVDEDYDGDHAFNGNIGAWDTSNVTTMANMFTGAASFNQDLNGWNTSSVTTMDSMFKNASTFDGDVSSWNTSGVTTFRYLFNNAIAFNQDISAWDVSNVTDLYYAFSRANAFDQDLSTWDVSKVTDMSGVFARTQAFNGDIGGWTTTSATDMGSMFSGAASFDQNIGAWDTSNVTDMSSMFRDTSVFNQEIGGWDTSNVTDMGRMFENAEAFNANIGTWNTGNVTDMSRMFENALAFDANIGTWNTSNVTDMERMFAGTSAFNQPIGEWNTAKVTTMEELFRTATSFNQDINDWDTSSVTNMYRTFSNATSFNQPLGDWKTSGVTNMDRMFDGATAFNQDLDTRCVPQFSEMPDDFDAETPTEWKRPKWGVGSCPSS